MRLALNAIPLLMPLTGIGQYTKNILREIAAYEDIEPYLFYAFRWGTEANVPSRHTVNTLRRLASTMLAKRHSLARAIQQAVFSAGIAKHHIEIYHEPNFIAFKQAGPTVVTVHDLTYLRYPETCPKHRLQLMENRLATTIADANYVIANSEFVRKEIIEVFAVNPAKVRTTLLGVRDVFRPRTIEETKLTLDALRLEHGRYILSVATLEPRKNLICTLRAYAQLPDRLKERFPFVVAGMRGWHTEAIEAEIAPLVRRGHVKVLDYVHEETLPDLYAGAAMLVYPSLYEGFGLPPLEAMASGIPVVTSNRSSLPEVVGDVGLQVDPDNIDDISGAMLMLLEDPTDAKRRGEQGVKRAATFSWQRCAKETVEVYRRAYQC